MIITWDEPKRQKTLAERGLDFADLDAGFFEAAGVYPAKEGRFMAIGLLDEVMLSVVFAPLGAEAIAVISMRRASRREREAYHARTKA